MSRDEEDGTALPRYTATIVGDPLLAPVGYLRKTSSGWAVDQCPTDEDHMAAPADNVESRRKCRIYIDEILEHLMTKAAGRKVLSVQVAVVVEPEDGGAKN